MHNGYAEKVYLQLDNTAYATNQTIWFKVIVIQAMDNLPTGISKVLHVELIDDEERVIKSKLLELNHGIAENYFEVTKDSSNSFQSSRANGFFLISLLISRLLSTRSSGATFLNTFCRIEIFFREDI